MRYKRMLIIGIILLILTTAGIMLAFYFKLSYIILGAIAVVGYGVSVVLMAMSRRKLK